MRRSARLALAVLATLALSVPAGTSALASTSGAGSPAQPDLRALEQRLDEIARDPLAAFSLSLGISRTELGRVLPVKTAGRLKAGPDVYEHVALRAHKSASQRAPGGLALVDGDFIFVAPGQLVEATLAVRAEDGNELALNTLERNLGKPEFEVLLPGALEFVVGWRAPGGYVIATFGDVGLFHVSAFPELPEDLVAGSQIVLYEGFALYARKLEAGSPVQAIAGELLDVVRWVTKAREKLQPLQ